MKIRLSTNRCNSPFVSVEITFIRKNKNFFFAKSQYVIVSNFNKTKLFLLHCKPHCRVDYKMDFCIHPIQYKLCPCRFPPDNKTLIQLLIYATLCTIHWKQNNDTVFNLKIYVNPKTVSIIKLKLTKSLKFFIRVYHYLCSFSRRSMLVFFLVCIHITDRLTDDVMA